MTVYVDDMRRPADLTGRPARWSHLMADTHDELMQAALDLGLRSEWIQHEGTYREHFDVTETVRQRAIAAGIAQPMPYPRGTGELLARKREANPPADPPKCAACARDEHDACEPTIPGDHYPQMCRCFGRDPIGHKRAQEYLAGMPR